MEDRFESLARSDIPWSRVEADLHRYTRFGDKGAGGPGDTACGEWLAAELDGLGYEIERQAFLAPFFDPLRAELSSGAAVAHVHPQPIVIPTGNAGLSGKLVRVDQAGRYVGTLDGAIALIDLPSARWSSMMNKAARAPVEAAFAAGARAAVVITNGPTGKVIALNADGRRPMFGGPVALLAPDCAGDFFGAAMRGDHATITVTGDGGHRPAVNFVGRLDRGGEQWIVISTPRSGWFACAAERGPGVAAWLDLARWGRDNLAGYNLAFVCNTGHEYEYLGAAEAMKQIAPPPAITRFWLHLGANVAAKDWHNIIDLSPLPNVDSQRYLSITPALLPLARTIFAGQPGYEAPVSSDILSAGELDEVIRAGYAPAAGVFGIHLHHHGAGDDERCLHLPGTVSAIQGFRRLLMAIAQAD
ncbi:hypothetical protein [Hephaestia mangrovi]|uniref:hypothetical protein n=1 Tax=Hephaestia mangrovi TaxID=2873268 RepID=UPI001CA72813|nr:hypothetical protein [Hephaestia mangrovi]MBY8829906.1 hypothetical protein [Hephaestia mangrovi]